MTAIINATTVQESREQLRLEISNRISEVKTFRCMREEEARREAERKEQERLANEAAKAQIRTEAIEITVNYVLHYLVNEFCCAAPEFFDNGTVNCTLNRYTAEINNGEDRIPGLEERRAAIWSYNPDALDIYSCVSEEREMYLLGNIWADVTASLIRSCKDVFQGCKVEAKIGTTKMRINVSLPM